MDLRAALRRGGLIVSLLAAPAGRGMAQQNSAKPTRPVPKALADAGEHGEDLYDAARANAWSTAARRLTALEADVAGLRADLDADRLEREVAPLNHSVARRQRQATMAAANQVTLAVADLTAPYAPSVPVEVTRLDAYGRELEIWSETGAVPRLESAARGMRHEWDAVHPAVAARDPAVARQFDALVARVERAKSPAEYRRLAAAELEAVDHLERVFEH